MQDDLRATVEGFLLEQLVMELGNAQAGLALVSPHRGAGDPAVADLALARIAQQLSRLEDSARRISRLLVGNRVAANDSAAQTGLPMAVPLSPEPDALLVDVGAPDNGDDLLARLIAVDSFTTFTPQAAERPAPDTPMFRSCRG
ncbi:MAG: hypothetical protein ACRCSU_09015 [Paracoccaceae bacterium]